MPTTPWANGPSRGDSELFVLTSMLPLARWRDLPRFIGWALKIRKQLKDAPGLVGYSLDARLGRKTFWTLSAWNDKDAMERFVRSGPHVAMLSDLAGSLGPSRFVESSASPEDLPLEWAAARRRIAGD